MASARRFSGNVAIVASSAHRSDAYAACRYAIERVKQIHRIAVSDDAVFLVTNMESGYGFAVWRLSTDLADPTRVVEGLAGCCGQMDVQVGEGGLAIAENSRHQVRLQH